jgi:hypothetical protein
MILVSIWSAQGEGRARGQKVGDNGDNARGKLVNYESVVLTVIQQRGVHRVNDMARAKLALGRRSIFRTTVTACHRSMSTSRQRKSGSCLEAPTPGPLVSLLLTIVPRLAFRTSSFMTETT